MAYAKQTWVDGPAGGTPINAARLNHMESGIEAADAPAPVSSVMGQTGAVTGLALDSELDAEIARATAAEAANLATTSAVSGLYFPTSLAWGHSFHGKFWDTGVALNSCWWDAWVKVASTSHYWISEGYGGAHSVLVGWGGTRNPTCNMGDGSTTTVTLGGEYVAANGEWLHDTFVWDGAYIWRYVNGIPVGRTAYSGTRGAQQGTLFIGGSNHQTFLGGTIAMVRGFEGTTTTDLTSLPAAAGTGYAFRPAASPVDYIIFPERLAYPDFLSVYSSRTLIQPDLSSGYNSRQHPGLLRGDTTTGTAADSSVNAEVSWPSNTPVPTFDTTSPLTPGQNRSAPVETTKTAPATPTGARIFDSFSRANQTYAFQRTPTLGSTESGSLGAKAWSAGAVVFAGGNPKVDSWGILDGKACYLYPNDPGIAFVENSQANMDVRVNRSTQGITDMHHTGLLFRGVDFSNFLALNTTGAALASASIVLKKYVAGVLTQLAVWVAPTNNWTTLRVVVDGANLITGYVDNLAGGWTSVGSITDATHATGTKAGLFCAGAPLGMRRFDNFTVV